MKSKILMIAIIITICLTVIACRKEETTIIKPENVVDIKSVETTSPGPFDDITDPKLKEAIEQNVIFRDGTELESCEWVDAEKTCLRVRIQYTEEPINNYRHKEDYFFFMEQGGIQALYVDYPDKDNSDIGRDRYVWNACDFNAYLEDVTFDGHKDLIIFLGHSGSHGTCISTAYVYEEGSYRYKSSFENIPNYELDIKNQTITGKNVNSVSSSTSFVYKYQNGEFVEIDSITYKMKGI